VRGEVLRAPRIFLGIMTFEDPLSPKDLIHWTGVSGVIPSPGATYYCPTLIGETADPIVAGRAPRVYFSCGRSTRFLMGPRRASNTCTDRIGARPALVAQERSDSSGVRSAFSVHARLANACGPMRSCVGASAIAPRATSATVTCESEHMRRVRCVWLQSAGRIGDAALPDRLATAAFLASRRVQGSGVAPFAAGSIHLSRVGLARAAAS
jgi:hypothetical protein